MIEQAGWYHLDFSSKIKKGKVYTFNYFNTSFVGFRDSNNILKVFDAYCPHLGAHLGKGGKIQNDQLICPFHGWRYNTSGQCVNIPYCEKIPKKAQLRCYSVKEINNFIFFYYHPSTDETIKEFSLEKMFASYIKIKPHKCIHIVVSNQHLQILMSLLEHQGFTLQADGPGFYIISHANKEIIFAMTASPVNRQQVSIYFTALSTTNQFLINRLLNQNRVRKKIFSMLKLAQIL